MPESLRILFVTPFGLAHKTTVWARTLPLAKELRALGHHANILAPPWDSPEDAGVDMTIDGVTVHNLPIGGGLWRSWCACCEASTGPNRTSFT